MKRLLLFCLFPVSLASAQNLTQYVNTFIGTGGHGHTFPGAAMPFGAVQLSPDTRPDGYNDWDGCGGYHYSDSIIYGFSHTHLSGTGVADYCDVLLMPTIGEPVLKGLINQSSAKGYASAFSHNNEKSSPGYYSVLLNDDQIQVELTTTTHVGMHKYQFPASTQSNIILDLTHRDKLLEGSYIEIISPTKVQGLRRSSSWARDQWVYFAIEFSQPITAAGIQDTSGTHKTTVAAFKPSIISGQALKAYFRFNTNGKDPVIVKCALSSVSCAGAWQNMKTEVADWDFNKVRQNADAAWNEQLHKIVIESPEDAKKSLTDPDNKLVIFYTALYHCMLAPYVFEDVDGKYRTMGNKINTSPDHTQYTVFSLWDTFRALHPLFTIIEPQRTNDFINTFLHQYQEGGRLPVWELSGNETECMIGYHSVSVIADAAVKGYNGFDRKLALEAMVHGSRLDHFGLRAYKQQNFIESNAEPESVSKTLEYAYDDWCIAQMAKLMPDIASGQDEQGKYAELAQIYFYRSTNYTHLLNNDGFAQPRFNGGWYTPFDPFEVNFNYTEANSWQYSFFYPQYLINIGNSAVKKQLETRLDNLFSAQAKTTGREQADITGLIGQYAHGNEPSHHIAYLYNYAGTPWKTQEKVHQILTSFYKNSPDGLIGNEDCGQMSAWYVLSALGLYQVCPGDPEFTITTPLFASATIHTEKPFVIKKSAATDKSIYISGMQLGGKEWSTPTIDYASIMQGGTLNCTVQDKPNMQWGIKIQRNTAVPKAEHAPAIVAKGSTFTDKLLISIDHTAEQNVEYSINNGPLTKYAQPFEITATSTVSARAFNKNTNQSSPAVKGQFTKIPKAYVVQYKTMYNAQYTGGGNLALIDGLHGTVDFRTGQWQGWWGENMELVLDLGEATVIDTVGGEFLQDVRSWIWMPGSVVVSVSVDGKKFTEVTTLHHQIPANDYESKVTTLIEGTIPPTNARYVQFKAVNFGKVPDWHPGKGGNTWVFCDEIWAR